MGNSDDDEEVTVGGIDDMPDEIKRALIEKLTGLKSKIGSGKHKPPMQTEAIMMTLREISDAYQAPCPYKIGDYVTPRKGRANSHVGHPAIVIELPKEPLRNFVGQDSVTNAAYGRKLDMRILQYTRGGDMVAFWVESQDYEPFKALKEEKPGDDKKSVADIAGKLAKGLWGNGRLQ